MQFHPNPASRRLADSIGAGAATAADISPERFAWTSSRPRGSRQAFRSTAFRIPLTRALFGACTIQREPDSEVKVVRCLKGSIWDVIIDIRPDSPTYCRWQKFELSGESGDQLYIPAGFAHGFQTLCDDVVVNYLISVRYAPQSAWGVRYNDPTFAIDWPLPVSEISAKDAHWPDFSR